MPPASGARSPGRRRRRRARRRAALPVARASAWSATRPAATVRHHPGVEVDAPRPIPFPHSSRNSLGRTRPVQHGRRGQRGRGNSLAMQDVLRAVPVPVLEAHVRGRGRVPSPGSVGTGTAPSLARSARALDLATQDLDPIRERSEPITRSRWPRCRPVLGGQALVEARRLVLKPLAQRAESPVPGPALEGRSCSEAGATSR